MAEPSCCLSCVAHLAGNSAFIAWPIVVWSRCSIPGRRCRTASCTPGASVWRFLYHQSYSVAQCCGRGLECVTKGWVCPDSAVPPARKPRQSLASRHYAQLPYFDGRSNGCIHLFFSISFSWADTTLLYRNWELCAATSDESGGIAAFRHQRGDAGRPADGAAAVCGGPGRIPTGAVELGGDLEQDGDCKPPYVQSEGSGE